jgi:urea transport system ATP-binding protein
MKLLQMTGVSVAFSGFRALRDLDFAVEEGELRCLIGPNGAGKTTTLDVICGKARASTGEVVFRGRRIGRLDEHRIARLGIGRKFQVPSVFRELTVRDNLHVAYCKRPGVFSNLLAWQGRSAAEELEKLAEFVGLSNQFQLPASALSHGQTQWLEIAMLMAQDAQLILLDEPTAGMTAVETRKTADLCKRLAGRHTLIVVEHDMAFIKEIAEVISVMHQGRLLAQGSVHEIEIHPDVRAAYLGSGGISGA